MGAYLPVIKSISDGNGVVLDPAEELRFVGVSIGRVTGDGPDRVEVYGASPLIASTTALAEVDVSLMLDGTTVQTAAPRSMTLRLGPADEVLYNTGGLGSTAFASSDTNRVWYRDIHAGSPGANRQKSWFVNAATGSDENDGADASTPLLTTQEAMYRIGHQPIDGSVGNGTVTVFILGDDTAPLTIDVRFIHDGNLNFLGTRTVLATYTMTTVTAWNDATGAIGSYSLSGTPDLITLGYVGRLCRIASGSQTGDKTAIVKETSTGTFRGNFANQATGQAIVPSGTPSVQVYSIPSLSGEVRISGGPCGPSGGIIYFEALNIGVIGSNHSVIVTDGQVQFAGCIIHGLDIHRGAYYAYASACFIYEARSYSQFEAAGCSFASVGGVALASRESGIVIVSGRCLVQGYCVSVGHASEGGAQLRCTAQLAVVDSASDGITCFPGSSTVLSTNVTIRDCAGSIAGIRVRGGANLQYTTGAPPKFSGTAADSEYVIGPDDKTAVDIAGGDYTASNGACVAKYA